MTAAISMDYQDAVLVCLMWHAFGRASDVLLEFEYALSVSANVMSLCGHLNKR